MDIRKFSSWSRWEKRNDLEGIKNPGIYLIAITTENISGRRPKWIKNIVYVGMTNSLNGLRGRLNQFDRTIISGKPSIHGGADRVKYKHNHYVRLLPKLYVAIRSFECELKTERKEDRGTVCKNWRIKGEVAKLEYDCLAEYIWNFGKLPQFNDQKRSPKYSNPKKKRK